MPEHTRVKGAFEFSALRPPRNRLAPLIHQISKWFDELKIQRGLCKRRLRIFSSCFSIPNRILKEGREQVSISFFDEKGNRNLPPPSSMSYKIRKHLLHEAPSNLLKKKLIWPYSLKCKTHLNLRLPLIFGCVKWKKSVSCIRTNTVIWLYISFLFLWDFMLGLFTLRMLRRKINMANKKE